MRIIMALMTISLALACGTAGAQAYRWVDKDGKVRYGDSPPPGVKATSIKGAAAAPAPAPSATPAKDGKAAPKPPVDPTQAFNERQLKAKEDAAKAEQGRAEREEKQRNCERAQGNLRSLESGQRIASTNAQGERTYLDDASRQSQIDEMKAEVGRSCK